MLDPQSSLARTPLFNLALAQNARFTSFSGWEMPLQYTSLGQEHEAVRTHAGLFDVSHMGKLCFTGTQLWQALDRLVPSDLSRLQLGQAQYTVLLNPQGGIIDDVIIYHQGEDQRGEPQAMMIVNAGTYLKDKEWLSTQLDQSGVKLLDMTGEKVLMALQGPQAENYLQPFVQENLTQLKFFEHFNGTILGQPGFIARTGYTGEDGFEVMVQPQVGIELWQKLWQAGVIPCGLGARDTLRLEAGLALYGQDIDETTTPLEAGLSWLVHLDRKGDFIGRSVLETQKAKGVERRLVGMEMEGRHIARHGYSVLLDGNIVGEITSGTYSPTLGKPIALAYCPTALAKIGQRLEVEIRGKTYPGVVVKKPFYRAKKH